MWHLVLEGMKMRKVEKVLLHSELWNMKTFSSSFFLNFFFFFWNFIFEIPSCCGFFAACDITSVIHSVLVRVINIKKLRHLGGYLQSQMLIGFMGNLSQPQICQYSYDNRLVASPHSPTQARIFDIHAFVTSLDRCCNSHSI